MTNNPLTPQEEQFRKLREPFPPDRVLSVDKSYTDKMGRRVEVILSYVGHADVTDRLLQADPHWTWEPLAMDANGLPVLDLADEATIGLWIKLSVAGVTRLGYGSVKRNAKEPIKELIGDALRNAAMRFGVALDLWRKDLGSLEETSHAPKAQAAAPAPQAAAPARQIQLPRTAPRSAPKGTTTVMGLEVLAFDWEVVKDELVGGNGKKKEMTWGALAEPNAANEHYLDWCFQNTEKEAAQGKSPTPWMSKAVLAYSKLREAQDGPPPAEGLSAEDVPF